MTTKTFRVLAALLTYPKEEIVAAAPSFKAALDEEDVVPARLRPRLDRLIDELTERDLYDLQERYILLFDRSKSLSLHLFEHVHGEGRDRGQAMVDLQEVYAKNGLLISASELPDFMPLFLEFLSTLDDTEARDFLGQPLHVIVALKERLRRRKSVYAAVFRAIESLATATPDAKAVAELLAEEEDDPEDLDALDKAWEEEAVTFGANAPGAPGAPGQDDGCPAASDMVARMNLEPPGAASPIPASPASPSPIPAPQGGSNA